MLPFLKVEIGKIPHVWSNLHDYYYQIISHFICFYKHCFGHKKMIERLRILHKIVGIKVSSELIHAACFSFKI